MYTTQHTDGTHLSQEDRAVIAALRNSGATLRAIAQVIHKHYSTVCRELLRNTERDGAYNAERAQKKCRVRRVNAKYGARKIENDPTLARRIEAQLRGNHPLGDWSPAAIAQGIQSVCHQTIYSWIRRCRPDLRRILPRRGKYRRQYGSSKQPSRGWTTRIRSIETRPKAVVGRKQLGHYEGDTVRLGRSFAMLTLVERTSKFLIAELITGQVGMVYAVHEGIVGGLGSLPPALRRTLTPDRGGEFAYWDMTEQEVPGLRIYFAHPHSPWERGTNEHTNGLLRRYFSKKDNHESITKAQVAEVVRMINHRPRKSLNWETPCKVFGACCVSR